jgi:hypothetical protein
VAQVPAKVLGAFGFRISDFGLRISLLCAEKHTGLALTIAPFFAFLCAIKRALVGPRGERVGGSFMAVAAGAQRWANEVTMPKSGFGAMKPGFLAAFLLAGALSARAACVPPAPGLVAWWPASGNGNDVIGGDNASVPASVSYVPAEVGSGFSLNGGPDRILAPDSPGLDFGAGQDFSIEAWIRPLPAPGNWQDVMTILDKRIAPDTITQQGYQISLTSGVFQFQMADTLAAYSWHNFGGGPDLRDGQFHHVAVSVIRAATNGGVLYVDGQVVLTFDPTVCPGNLSNNAPVRIGNHPVPGLQAFYYGVIDEPSVYNRALSAAEIQAVYNANTAGKCLPQACVLPPSGLVGWWKADGNALDSVAGNNGVLQNVSFTPGEVGQTFAFDPENLPNGTYSGVQIADQPAYVLTNSLTIEAWVRPRGDSYVIFFRGDNRPGLDPYVLSMQANNIILFGISDESGNYAAVQTPLIYNQWWHIAATLDGGSGTLSLFTNGVLAAQSNTTVRPFGALLAGDSPGIGIGNVNDGGNNFPFIGDIDELSLYNRALSSAEIQSIYNAGSAGKCPPAIPPSITSQPAGATVIVGGSASFYVAAQGTPPLAYQWYFGPNALAGKTDTSLSLANIQFNQAGGYTVIVTNAFGSATSAVATLTVNPAPPCAPAPPGIIGWWKAENNGLDIIGGDNGVLQNVSFTSGIVGQAFAFDPESYPYGTYTGVQIADQPIFALTNSLSIEAWIRPRGDGYQIFFRGDHRPGLDPYSLSMQGNNILGFYVTDQNGNSASVQAPLMYNQWWHVAATLDDASGLLRLYTNSVLAAQTNTTIRPFGSLIPSESPGIGIGNLNDGGNNFPFLGDIDELALYARALSPAEILSIYNASSSGKCVSPPPAVPAIFNVSPPSATNGAVITITGTNFSTSFANNIVYFGAVRATVLAATTTTLTVAVPPGAIFAPISVTVNGLAAWSPAAFVPTFVGNGAVIDSSTLAPGFNLPAQSGPIQVTLADLDGDGKPDLVVASAYAHTVSVYQNIGGNSPLSAGSFASPIVLAVGSGTDDPLFVVAADVDGDGKLDLVVPDRLANQVIVFQNLSTGGTLTSSSFAPPVGFNVGADPRKVAVQDLDGDGRPEIVTANYNSSTLSILPNIGAPGTLTSNSFGPSFELALPSTPDVVALADLDGDGKPDLAVGNGAWLSVLRNTSSPGALSAASFAARTDLPVPDGAIGLVVGDLDGDGKPDLLLGSYLGETMSVYRNIAYPGSLSLTSFAARVDFVPGGRFHISSLGDLNGDGKPDVAIVTELPSHLSVFQNLSTPGDFTANSLGSRVDFGSGWNAWGVAVGDLDGDGRPDVVFGNAYDSTLTLNRNVSPFGGLPFFQTQPLSQTVTVGNSAMFSALAGGSLPLSYQWQFNGTNIAGATNTSFALLNVQPAQAGNYSVVVSNPAGQTQSSNAVLTVNPAVCSPPDNSLAAWWRGEGDTSDAVGGNAGLLQGGAAFQTGKAGQAFAFNGVSSFVQVPSSPVLKPTGPFTVEAWVNYSQLTGANGGTIVMKGPDDEVPADWALAISAAQKLRPHVNLNGNWLYFDCATTLLPGIWYHVALVYDGAALSGYVNGQLDGSFSASGTVRASDYPLKIGAYASTYPPGSTSFFDGGIDDLSFYSTALSPAAIQAIYNAASAGKCVVSIPPFIVVQPQNTAVLPGASATFAVLASGSVPLSYQWMLNGAAIPSETNVSLTLPTVSYPQNGNLYSVLVTNSAGSASSTNAILTIINTPPLISTIPDQQVPFNTVAGPLSFTVTDAESPADSLQVSASSSNTNLVPNEQIVLGGTGTNRTVTLTPNSNQIGVASITLTVTDPGGLSAQSSFNLTVADAPPVISAIGNQHTPINLPTAPLPFTVSDPDNSADTLLVTASSSNTNVVPNEQIVLGGTGTNRTVTITPGLNQAGGSVIRLTVTDPLGLSASTTFTLVVDQFTQIAPGLPVLQYSSIAWGDYDNDGQLDLAVTGTTNSANTGAITRIYHNDNGSFTNFITLPGVYKAAVAWADYDRDGYLDLVVSGLTASNTPSTRLYHNNGDGTFTDANAGFAGAFSGSVAWGDFNNDGAPDLFLCGLIPVSTNLTTVFYTNLAKLYRNDGGGHFTDLHTSLPGPNGGTAAWGDYDNDGRLDLLLVGNSNSVSPSAAIYRNLGNGNFTNINANLFTYTAGASAAWGDFDDDGRLDVVIANQSGPNYLYRNTGNGFSIFTSFAGVGSPTVAWGDYDNDGRLDLLIAGSPTHLYHNNTNNTFTDSGLLLPAAFNGSGAWGDFNSDGALDLVQTGQGQTLLQRNNSGVLNSPPAAPIALVASTRGTNTAILTWSAPADGQTPSSGLNYNLRVGTTPGGFDVVAPQADALTGQRRLAAMGNASPTNRALLINLPKGTYYWSVQAIDTTFAGSPFGAEGTFFIENSRPTITSIPDQVIAPHSPTANVPFTIGDTETSASNLVVTARSSNTNVVAITNVVFGGFGSNRTVRVTPRTNGIALVTVTVTDAQGAFATADFLVTAEYFTLVSSSFIAVQNSAVAWGDYDNDGRLDVVICGNTNGNLLPPPTVNPLTRLYHNDGNGVFTPVAAGLPNATFGSLAWADFDNDGYLDLLITGTTNNQSYGGMARVYRNLGNGTFTNINAGLPGVYASAVAWGDYDNDGRPDILLTGSTNGSYTGAIARLYHNNGDGTFSNAVSFTGIFQGAVAFSDFDGDGRLDVVLAGLTQVNIPYTYVYRNLGNGSFAAAASLVGVYNCSVAVGDYDNDGRPDILLAGYNGSFISRVYRNNGNFSFSDALANLPGLTAASVAWGDFDNDGRLDILLSGSTTTGRPGGLTRVYRNTGAPIGGLIFSNYAVNLPTNSFGAVAWADFDNDGDLDILLSGSDGVLVFQQPRSQTFLYRNNTGNVNTPPSAPTALASSRTNNILTLTWAKSSDPQTTNANGLKYQLRVGTSPGGIQTESPNSNPATGYRRIVAAGDASTNKWLLANLPPGTYYWGVQAVDTAFVGSPFSAEATFTVLAPPIAVYDLLTTPTNTPVVFPAAKLLVNDSSPGGFPLTVTAVNSPSSGGGSVQLVNGLVYYSPPPNDFQGNAYTGIDTFAYTVADNQGGSAVAAVFVTVGSGYLGSLNIVFGPTIDGTDFVVGFAGIPGLTYTIESGPTTTGPWTKVTNLTAPTTDNGLGVGVFQFRDPMGTDTMRFYRTVYPPY